MERSDSLSPGDGDAPRVLQLGNTAVEVIAVASGHRHAERDFQVHSVEQVLWGSEKECQDGLFLERDVYGLRSPLQLPAVAHQPQLANCRILVSAHVSPCIKRTQSSL